MAIVHFEIPADDISRAQNFYSKLFGWEITKMEGPMEYWGVKTKGKDTDPGINGGLMKRQSPQHTVTNYEQVASIDETIAKAKELEGKVIVDKTAIPGMGHFAILLDTENNPLGLWQSEKPASA